MTAVQLNIMMLGLGGLQGIFLFLLLFKKRHALPGYVFLAAYLLVLLLQISLKLASKLWLMQTVGPLYSFSYQLPFLYGPLIWLFVRQLASHRPVTTKDILHFLPTIAFLSLYILGSPRKHIPVILVPLFDGIVTMILQLISLLVYHTLAFYKLKKYRKSFNSPIAGATRYRLVWLQQFVVSSFILCAAISVIICTLYYQFPHWQNIRFGFVGLTAFIYWISYKAWSQPELFSVIRGYSSEAIDRTVATKLTAHLPAKKYSNSGLADQDMQQIIAALENKMRVDKCYLNADLTIDTLADSLACSRHHLSQAINDKLEKSFYDFVNQYRVEEAIQLLTDPQKANYKIASIAYDAGFNSISTFNDVFKKMTGSTPSQYRKQPGEKKLQKQRV